MKVCRKMLARKVIGERVARCTSRVQFGAPLLDEPDLCLKPVRFLRISL